MSYIFGVNTLRGSKRVKEKGMGLIGYKGKPILKCSVEMMTVIQSNLFHV